MRANDPVNPLDGVLKGVGAMGYDGIELMLDPESPLAPGWKPAWSSEDISPSMREQFRESAVRHGVEIATLSADWAWSFSQMSPKLAYWQRGTELLKSDVGLAGDLGAKVILIHVGAATGSWSEIKSIVEQVVEVGVKRQVKVAFEAGIFARIGLGALDSLIRLVDEIDSPWFGVYEHCYWPRGTTQPHEEIALVGAKRIKGLHSSALNVQVDYAKMIQALKDVGYDYYWTFEVSERDAQSSVDGYKYLMAKYSKG
jgi:sugar phosphate isomerase/epimerase